MTTSSGQCCTPLEREGKHCDGVIFLDGPRVRKNSNWSQKKYHEQNTQRYFVANLRNKKVLCKLTDMILRYDSCTGSSDSSYRSKFRGMNYDVLSNINEGSAGASRKRESRPYQLSLCNSYKQRKHIFLVAKNTSLASIHCHSLEELNLEVNIHVHQRRLTYGTIVHKMDRQLKATLSTLTQWNQSKLKNDNVGCQKPDKGSEVVFSDEPTTSVSLTNGPDIVILHMTNNPLKSWTRY